MKKLLALSAFAVVLAGCSHQQSPTQVTEQSSADTAKEFSEMATAMQSGKSVQCVMTNKEGVSMTYMVKGKKMKTIGIATAGQAGTSSMLVDTEYMYTWSDAKKEGVKFKLPKEEDLKEFSKTQGQEIPDFSSTEAQKEYEESGYKVNCDVKDISDSEFVAPSDVKFIDTSAMMEQVQKMGTQAGTPSPEQMKKYEEMTKQLQQQYEQ